MGQFGENELPSAVLKAEHQVILRVVGVLGRLVSRARSNQGFEAESFKECVEFLRNFADACHHAKEEDLLFPAIESRGVPREGGPIGVMLYEHGLARGYTKDMGAALDDVESGDQSAQERVLSAARQYIDLLQNHIFKEDNVLYPMGDGVLTPEDQNTLCGKFCEMACRSFGGKNREELERIANELEARWPG